MSLPACDELIGDHRWGEPAGDSEGSEGQDDQEPPDESVVTESAPEDPVKPQDPPAPEGAWTDCWEARIGGISGDACDFGGGCSETPGKRPSAAELPGRSAACLQIPSILVVTENVVEELVPGEPPLDGVTRSEGPCVAQPSGSSTREVMCAPDELLAPSLDAPVISVEGPEVCIDLKWDAAARPGRPCVGEHLCVVNFANQLGAQPVAIFCHESRLRFAAVGGP